VTGPVLLDLFCKAGGAAWGYAQAGFDVVGVDVVPQPRYPFPMLQADALGVLDGLVAGADLVVSAAGCERVVRPIEVAVVHASPPCQDYSVTRALHGSRYPRLIGPVRERLRRFGCPYVIENVEGARADLLDPVLLCGSMFGLGVRRHRLFEVSVPLGSGLACDHASQPWPVDVTGTGGRRATRRSDGGGGDSRKPRNIAHAREAMGIEWMTRRELSEAIPPAMTEWLGASLFSSMQ
jgi:DNA (cytosine-5)-methyltransferase 1